MLGKYRNGLFAFFRVSRADDRSLKNCCIVAKLFDALELLLQIESWKRIPLNEYI
jgi:hypothetical protein